MKLVVFAILLVGLCPPLLATENQDDFTFIDDYLVRWDQFAQGNNDLASSLKTDEPAFEEKLGNALMTGDKRAMGRAVFSAVVQVGGFIPLDSPIGKGIEKESKGGVAIFTSDSDGKTYFAGDLYDWWLKNRTEFADYPLLEDYMKRDFARDVVLKMYESVKKNK